MDPDMLAEFDRQMNRFGAEIRELVEAAAPTILRIGAEVMTIMQEAMKGVTGYGERK